MNGETIGILHFLSFSKRMPFFSFVQNVNIKPEKRKKNWQHHRYNVYLITLLLSCWQIIPCISILYVYCMYVCNSVYCHNILNPFYLYNAIDAQSHEQNGCLCHIFTFNKLVTQFQLFTGSKKTGKNTIKKRKVIPQHIISAMNIP